MKKLFYLYLLAIVLVSCGREITEQEVLTLNTLQESMYKKYDYGWEQMSYLRECTEDKSEPFFQTKSQILFSSMLEIDRLTGECIKIIESVKTKLRKDISTINKYPHGQKPITFDFAICKDCGFQNIDYSKVKSNKGSKLLSQNGELIRNAVVKFRKLVLAKMENSWNYGNEENPIYFFKDPMIDEYGSQIELRRKLEKYLKTQNVNMDDQESLIQSYLVCTKTKQQWDKLLLEYDSWVDAMEVLLCIQNEILEVRSLVLRSMNLRVAYCGSGFDRVRVAVLGSNYGVNGDTLNLELFVGAYNTYNEPTIEVGGLPTGSFKVIKSEDGVVSLGLLLPNQTELDLSGTITVKNRTGDQRRLPWSHKVKILPKPAQK